MAFDFCQQTREKEFLKCLQSNPKIELNTTWEVAREVLKDELPFKAITREKWKETIFERHIRELQVSHLCHTKTLSLPLSPFILV
jgi:hypothetical protein